MSAAQNTESSNSPQMVYLHNLSTHLYPSLCHKINIHHYSLLKGVQKANMFASDLGTDRVPSDCQWVAESLDSDFLHGLSLQDIDTVIRQYQQLLNATPAKHVDRASRLEKLGIAFHTKYQQTSGSHDLEAALEKYLECVEATAKEDPQLQIRLHYLQSIHDLKFEESGELAELNECIRNCHQAVACINDRHPDYSRRVQRLAGRLRERSWLTGCIADLDNAVNLCKHGLAATLREHVDWPVRAHNLASTCYDRFQIRGEKEDLATCFQYYLQALDATPSRHPARARRLDVLGGIYVEKYELDGDVADLQAATQYFQDVVNATTLEQPERASRLQKLGVAYFRQHQRLGHMKHLQLSLDYFQEALDLTPKDHQDYGYRMFQLGVARCEKFKRNGNMDDLSVGIRLLETSIQITPESHPDYVHQVYNLAVAYGDACDKTSDLNLLDASIENYQKGLEMTPSKEADRARQLQNLGSSYQSRYERRGALSDLKIAIDYYCKAREITSKDSLEWPERLQHIGVGYHAAFDRGHKIEDINIVINMYQEALDLTPLDDPRLPQRQGNIGRGYYERYQLLGDMADLDTAIRWHKIALDTTRETVHRSFILECLGAEYQMRYRRLEHVADLEEATRKSQEALDETPDKDSNRARRMHYVATCFHLKHKRTNESENLKKALEYLHNALNYPDSTPMDRFPPGKMLLDIYTEAQNWSKAYEVASAVVSLVPLLVSASLDNSDKQFILVALAEIAGLACDGAAVALLAEVNPYEAIALLELGRGVLIGTLSDLKVDISDLEQKHPELAERYTRLRDQLDEPVASHLDHLGTVKRANRRHLAGRELESLIDSIRELPGFGRFLLAPLESEVRRASLHGPIVIINVSGFRCDALILQDDQIRVLPLPGLRVEDIKSHAASLNARSISYKLLEWIWYAFARDILNDLGFVGNDPGLWPRVWWIPTGPLSKFPLHAAGLHFTGAKETVCDRVVSSYSSSIRALIRGRQQSDAIEAKAALLVAMRDTPNHPSLPFAAKEVAILDKFCKSHEITSIEPSRKKERVLSYLRDCKVFHFAGHGMAHHQNPLLSQLLLEDWEIDPLTVEDLLAMNIYKQSPLLAYLSACNTGRIPDGNFIDENVHLINAFQLVGFRHVLGTLWEVRDEICVGMAEMVYEGMAEEGMFNNSICRGLHRATREFRDRWVYLKDPARNVGCGQGANRGVEGDKASLLATPMRSCNLETSRDPRDVVALEDEVDMEAAKLLGWVPYVHYGI
ncbi:uncharacterized protein FMAN_05101 [Fusarium mangiferae]|uniref:CHAT domain-containing protein n=1 Tax=Fusarium mangiferae TaxID=192010 RepID=A0A1L7UC73_FUSMA|nr:uncharacterized protein FMAN_05101 [Fusarium mangiferae]CVL08300.1 uncharacterized protein FMAN_05101 [Fusarium mangiferae]